MSTYMYVCVCVCVSNTSASLISYTQTLTNVTNIAAAV